VRTSPYLAFALLVAAFLVFLFCGNIAPAIVLLALGLVFIVSGAGANPVPERR
jgi:hypothetical protein